MTNDTAMHDSVAVVIGASRGIGKGIALELGAAGAVVYVAGRTLETGNNRPGSVMETVRLIEEAGGRAVGARCDATDDTDINSLFERVRGEHGRLHVLVNSVFDASSFGATIGRKFWELPVSAWQDIVDVSTRSAYVACVEAAPLLLAGGVQRPALIVNVSALGARKYFYNVPYGVGKAALDKMTADMAIDFTGLGVATVSLWPNMTRTEGIDAAIAAGDTERFERFGGADSLETPRYNGRAVVALATDPGLMNRSGQYFWTAELGEAYGFTDEHGRGHAYPRRR